MLRKLPIDTSTFSRLRLSNYLYVDKTKYIYQMIIGGHRYFLSRPRRFGKSLLVSTLKEILIANKQLFDGLWIAQSDYNWQEYGVINLDFSSFKSSSLDLFKQGLCEELFLIAQQHHIIVDKTIKEPDFLLKTIIRALFEKYGRVAILIDEYDSQILKTLSNKELAKEIRNEVQQFFTVIKSLDAQVQFVFITGVSSFAKAGLFSGINNLQILTLKDNYSAICGYTDEEVDYYFNDYIVNWAQQLGKSYQDLRQQIKEWYDGYSFGFNITKVYNPFSLMNALIEQQFRNFWFQSGTPTFLVEILKKEYKSFDFEHLVATQDFLGVFDVGTIPLISLMFQAGYLTIVDYDPDSQNYILDFPNSEVRIAMQKYLFAVFAHTDEISAQRIFSQLFISFNNQDIERTIELLQQLLAHVPYQLHMKQEKFYHAILIMMCLGAGIKYYAEYSTSHGRIDLVLELPKVLYVVEIKFNDTAENALSQIEERRYYERFIVENKPIILLGVAFQREPHNFEITYAMKDL